MILHMVVSLRVLLFMLLALKVRSKTLFFEANDNILCPDKQGTCPDGTTCCQLPTGKYGCCPLPDAVCCSDQEHCCPNGYTCDIPHQQCSRSNGESIRLTRWFEKEEAKPVVDKSSSVVCPDGQSECPDGQTCCQLASGQWGCCPFPQAICCADHEHCCPKGFTCNFEEQTCRKGNGDRIPWSSKTESNPVKSKASESIVCPDGQSECPDGQTCCQLASGQWGCCPLPQAVCCSDHEHCCPNGYTCHVEEQTCTKGNGERIPWSSKTESNPIRSISSSVICPDGQSECPDGQTCCQLASGQWGCCPLPKAVCCSDHEHCCPNGYTCDLEEDTCKKGNGERIPWSSKTESIPIRSNSGSVVCPDGQSQCPDGQTCCKLASGQWGCCPLPQAVCCSDHEHCCPNGYTCDLEEETCKKGNGERIPWSSKTESNPIRSVADQDSNNICPDSTYCQSDATCCRMQSGHFGCCPLPKATCCDDLVHCCPSGYSCNSEQGTCVREDGFELPWATKIPSTPAPKADDRSLCSDAKSRCMTGSSCCSSSDSEVRGCCPYENAVCCSDGLHCCPSDTTCDSESQMCQSNKNSMAVSWNRLGKLEMSGFDHPAPKDVVCPDDKFHCPTDTTCCQMQSGLYSCCPFNQATCCEDKLHCCPSGMKCDVEHSTCVADTVQAQLPWEMFGRRRAKVVV